MGNKIRMAAKDVNVFYGNKQALYNINIDIHNVGLETAII